MIWQADMLRKSLIIVFFFQNFNTILIHEPDNVQANHNLCVVYVERGDLLRAEKCLEQTLNLEPKADYVRNHLNIVRSRISQIRQQQQIKQQQGTPKGTQQGARDHKSQTSSGHPEQP